MTAASELTRRAARGLRLRGRGSRSGATAKEPKAAAPRVPASPAQQASSLALAMLSGVLLALLVNLVGVSQLQHLTTQASLYHQLRYDLAEGSAPIGPLDANTGKIVALGAPVADFSAPELGIRHEVIVNGTSSAQTMQGIGHRRDTVLPCQVGTSVLMARSGGYGAVGQAWSRLQNGDRFAITMGQGSCTYQVTGQRLAGQKAPLPPAAGKGSLTLVTATGRPFMPSGVLRIDATLVTDAFPASPVAFPSGALPASEQVLGVDGSQLFPLTMLLEALVALAVLATWLWRRWNRVKTYIVATPLALALIFLTAQNVNLLLPNLL